MGRTFKYFKDWKVNKVSWWPFQSKTGTGEIVFGASESIDCYIAGGTVRVVDAQGREVISEQHLFLDGDDTIASSITEKDKFTVDDRDRPIRKIDTFYDETGAIDFLVVYL